MVYLNRNSLDVLEDGKEQPRAQNLSHLKTRPKSWQPSESAHTFHPQSKLGPVVCYKIKSTVQGFEDEFSTYKNSVQPTMDHKRLKRLFT